KQIEKKGNQPPDLESGNHIWNGYGAIEVATAAIGHRLSPRRRSLATSCADAGGGRDGRVETLDPQGSSTGLDVMVSDPHDKDWPECAGDCGKADASDRQWIVMTAQSRIPPVRRFMGFA
ncbi:hypothetical protein Dimus_037733, partial [Dionaea muscipula]